jgi:hypothetical protein
MKFMCNENNKLNGKELIIGHGLQVRASGGIDD